jgi:MFS family permease
MRDKLKAYRSQLFYGGTLISSIGSMTFNVALVAFMLKSGYSLFQATLVIGLQRLVPIIISFLFGDVADRIAPRLVVLTTELVAAIGTLGILWSWKLGLPGYTWLLSFSLLKSIGLSFQGGSRAVISKLLSTDEYASHSKNAIWLNNVTQGATLFGGALGFLCVRYSSLPLAIWFDFSTFAINGLFLCLLTVGKGSAVSFIATRSDSILKKFADFYRYNPRAAILDGLLALAMTGNMAFRARVAGSHEEWIPLFMLSYGIAVWVAGYVEQSGRMKEKAASIWIALGVSYALLGVLPEGSYFSFPLFLIRDTAYWLLLHRISSYIQADTPESVFGSVTAARNTVMIAIIASGEILVGAWQSIVPLSAEGLWRTTLCAIIAIMVLIQKIEPRLNYERPRI